MFCGMGSSSTARHFGWPISNPRTVSIMRCWSSTKKNRADADAAGAMSSQRRVHGGHALRGQRSAGRDLRAKESGNRPELAACGEAIQRGSRSARAALSIQITRSRSFRRRSGRGSHDDAVGTRRRRISFHSIAAVIPARSNAAREIRSIRPDIALAISGKRCCSATASSTCSGISCSSKRKEEKIDDGKGGKKRIVKETMIFPRYHQLDAVRKLVGAARNEGPSHNYLIQHSAGSGKTNSISWLSHRLASLHTASDEKIFDCVIVITDRRVLDKQLQDAIYQIEHAQGVVKAIDEDSRQLAAALVDGTKIVITTLQKFPFVLRGLLHVAGAESSEERHGRGEGTSERMAEGNRQPQVCGHRGRSAFQPDRGDSPRTKGDPRHESPIRQW